MDESTAPHGFPPPQSYTPFNPPPNLAGRATTTPPPNLTSSAAFTPPRTFAGTPPRNSTGRSAATPPRNFAAGITASTQTPNIASRRAATPPPTFAATAESNVSLALVPWDANNHPFLSPVTTLSLAVPRRPRPRRKPDPITTQTAPPCTECGRHFNSWKALFGHMRCHPERQWRGIVPPMQFRRPLLTSTHGGPYTEDELDVAASLLLLANGPPLVDDTPGPTTAVYRSPIRFECANCSRTFGSQQALGRHRTSHKCVKMISMEETMKGDGAREGGTYKKRPWEEMVGREGWNYKKRPWEETVRADGGREGGNSKKRPWEESSSYAMTTGTDQEHKCNVCSRGFSSGQALGGHMRCHWERGDEQGGAANYGNGIPDLNLPPPKEGNEGCSAGSDLDLKL